MPEPWHAVRSSTSSGGPAGPWLRLVILLIAALALTACGADASDPSPSAEPSAVPVVDATAEAPADSPAEAIADSAAQGVVQRPEWFDMEMIDVRTGEAYTINDFEGQVELIETMAVWCPTCQKQGDEVARLHEVLGQPEDLVSVSLDVDMGEDEELLGRYVERLGYDWRFAVAPLLVARALGNEYSAQYLNPPVSPMLIIDREGNVLGLPFGSVKSAESLQGVLEPILGA